MEEAAARWRYEQLHEAAPFHDGAFTEWSEERSQEHPYHFNDGVTILAAETNLYPDDDFLQSSAPSDSPL